MLWLQVSVNRGNQVVMIVTIAVGVVVVVGAVTDVGVEIVDTDVGVVED